MQTNMQRDVAKRVAALLNGVMTETELGAALGISAGWVTKIATGKGNASKKILPKLLTVEQGCTRSSPSTATGTAHNTGQKKRGIASRKESSDKGDRSSKSEETPLERIESIQRIVKENTETLGEVSNTLADISKELKDIKTELQKRPLTQIQQRSA